MKQRTDPEPRFWAMVEKTDDHWLFTGWTQPSGHGQFKPDRDTNAIGAHRYSYELTHGPIPKGYEIDHDYRCPKNCVRPSHLRVATRKQNNENLDRPRGASYCKLTHRWVAQVKHNGKRISVGKYDTKEEALEAARLKRLEVFTHNDFDREVSSSR